MTTLTLTQYAVQVRWPDDRWMFVTEGPADDLRPVIYETREDADRGASIWNQENVRVVSRTVSFMSITETEWEPVS